MGLEDCSKAFSDFGVSVNEAVMAFNEFLTYIPPFTKKDIEYVKTNPSLSIVDKIRIIRNMKNEIKGNYI